MSSHSICQWEIWQVTWEHLDDGTRKPRPALAVSTTKYNSQHDGAWFIKISGEKHEVHYRVELAPQDPAFRLTGLKKTSYFYPKDVRYISQGQVLYRRGVLGKWTGLLLLREIQKATGWEPR